MMTNRPKDPSVLSDDALIFWTLFIRDGMIAMRNADELRLTKEIKEEEIAFDLFLSEIKRRMSYAHKTDPESAYQTFLKDSKKGGK